MSHIGVMCDIVLENADILGSAEVSALIVFLFKHKTHSLRQGKRKAC